MITKNKPSLHPTAKKLFNGRSVVISTMHGKHHVMKPLIAQFLNINTVIVPDVDTDMFGTFSGEVERPFDAITTLRRKILSGLKVSGETLGLGNEGSFGPHPSIPFIQVDQEIVMLIDLENDLEIFETIISTETNHHSMEITCMKDLFEFAAKIDFPSHGIIMKQVQDGKVTNIRKGIITWEMLHAISIQFAKKGTQLIAETDMRGYMNPTRMKVIERATYHLMKKVVTRCPECQCPGFGVVKVNNGLPCNECGCKTSLISSKVYQCKYCYYTDVRTEANKAEPQYCDYCNP